MKVESWLSTTFKEKDECGVYFFDLAVKDLHVFSFLKLSRQIPNGASGGFEPFGTLLFCVVLVLSCNHWLTPKLIIPLIFKVLRI